MNPISVSFGEGDYKITGIAVACGEDMNLSFIGGTKPHIGAVSLALYEPIRNSATVSTIAVYTHRDGELSAKSAKEIATAFKCTTVVSVGIHVDHATIEELDILIKNFKRCCEKIIEKLANDR